MLRGRSDDVHESKILEIPERRESQGAVGGALIRQIWN